MGLVLGNESILERSAPILLLTLPLNDSGSGRLALFSVRPGLISKLLAVAPVLHLPCGACANGEQQDGQHQTQRRGTHASTFSARS
ncbi:hypothetical protein [Pseudomonas sp. Fl4BN1]|uniref:hypothetical protein n=1 Tax=Pseudomonas sp. Fl4BN1 TaxID=2697651 RepID=UPI0035583986